MNKLPDPVGAIWIRGFNLKERIKTFLYQRHVYNVQDHEIEDILSTKHTLSVKVNSNVEKYIALGNNKKFLTECKCRNSHSNRRSCPRCSQPDYFIHVYQSHTGAAPLACFSINPSPGPDGKNAQQEIRQNDSLGEGGVGDVASSQPENLSIDASAQPETKTDWGSTSDFSMGRPPSPVSNQDSGQKESS